jgi:hypothetical protein
MTAPLIYPVGQQWLGMAKETNYGTPVATPTVWIPVIGPKFKPNQVALKDQALRGSMGGTYQQVAGVRYDQLDYSTNLYLDSVFQHMMNILGGADVVTGAGDPWTHKTSLLNTGNGQPTSWTLSVVNGAECWQMAGAQQVSLDIETKVADSLAQLTPSWMGLPAVPTTAPTNTPTGKVPAPAWNTLLTIGGTPTTQYSDIKLSLKRENEAVFAANQTQAPYVIFIGGLTVTFDFTAVYQGYAGSVSDLANYLTNSQPAVVLQNNPAGDATHYAKWTHTKCAYDSASAQDNGKYMEVTASGEALLNATDANAGGLSPELFTLLTSVSAAY